MLRAWDFSRLEEETILFTDLFNDTFATHWGANPNTAAAMSSLTTELREFLVPDFTVFAEVEGVPVGVVYPLPDLNQALDKFRGKVIEESFAEFQQAVELIDHGVLLIIGVKQDVRGRGINLAMAAKSYLAMIERGYKTGSYTLVLDDNWPSRRTAEKLGAKVTRNFVTYSKRI
jgi:hypothetical protein